jgi:hypothetical protein
MSATLNIDTEPIQNIVAVTRLLRNPRNRRLWKKTLVQKADRGHLTTKPHSINTRQEVLRLFQASPEGQATRAPHRSGCATLIGRG